MAKKPAAPAPRLMYYKPEDKKDLVEHEKDIKNYIIGIIAGLIFGSVFTMTWHMLVLFCLVGVLWTIIS